MKSETGKKAGRGIHITPLEEHCHNQKNTTFQERGKSTGQGEAIASKEQ
jgi:hypothetical protein